MPIFLFIWRNINQIKNLEAFSVTSAHLILRTIILFIIKWLTFENNWNIYVQCKDSIYYISNWEFNTKKTVKKVNCEYVNPTCTYISCLNEINVPKTMQTQFFYEYL